MMDPRETAAYFERAVPPESKRPLIDELTYDTRLLHAILLTLLRIEGAVMHPPMEVMSPPPESDGPVTG